MELASAVLSVIVALVPGFKGLIGSMVYRNRARARAEIIRACQGPERRALGNGVGGKRAMADG
ncbi:hypothetical protein [Streptomyces sp. NPDC048644]|uniref:hypothetical protein n=1 Tax=Streptomyces sp. NPDC048644 TaxID=3365582 RepID=UPI00371C7EBC